MAIQLTSDVEVLNQWLAKHCWMPAQNEKDYAAKYSPEYCDLLNALRDFEQAHKAWMNLSVFTPEGEAAKQYKNSCGARYAEARRVWSLSQSKRDKMNAEYAMKHGGARVATHTPVPWTMDTTFPHCLRQSEGVKIAEAWGQSSLGISSKDNAEFILRACNCHEELLDACRSVLYSSAPLHPAVKEQLQQAIAKADQHEQKPSR